MNIRLEYLYRDGGNYKLRAHAVFANNAGWSVEAVKDHFDAAAGRWRLFTGSIHFRPERVGLPTCYFTEIGYSRNSDDFELHEVEEIEECEEVPTEGRTIQQFLADVKAAEG